MELKLKNSSESISVLDDVFNREFNEALIHQIVIAYQSAGRSGTKSQKTRSEVSGGGVKPWKQKGSGRARAGTIRSPLWRKGGVTFAAKPRDYTQKVNRKMYRAAISSIFSSLNNSERLFVVDNINLSSVKTKNFVNYIKNLSLGEDILFILNSVEEGIYLASRNLASINVIDVDMIDPVLLLQHKIVVIEKDAILSINGWLS